jgi:hypothetical protein
VSEPQRRWNDGGIEEVIDRMLTPPEPGERCGLCNRRVNKKRTENEPAATKRVGGVLPVERAEALDEGLDNLQEYAGVDPHSYPRGSLMEALLGLGARHREELRSYFVGE